MVFMSNQLVMEIPILSDLFRVSKQAVGFVRDVANDPRIPERDKKVLLALIALVLSPIDIIPDWIPVFGMMDDVVIMGIILDYLFNHLDREILLSHYPWDLKSFNRLKSTAQWVARLTPEFVKQRIWKFKPSIY